MLFGPPSNRDDANRMMSLFFSKEGKHIVCGGTTSSIAAKYLGKTVKASLNFEHSDVPPIAEIEGVDLVTEGVITVNKVLEYAKDYLGENKYYGGELDAERAAVLALFHDATEIITGDMPTPVKYYNDEIKASYKKVEAIACEKLLGMLPDELRPAYETSLKCSDDAVNTLVKAADKLSAYIKCLEELKAGNAEFKRAAEQTRASIDAMALPELDYFMAHCMPSFSMTLDELE